MADLGPLGRLATADLGLLGQRVPADLARAVGLGRVPVAASAGHALAAGLAGRAQAAASAGLGLVPAGLVPGRERNFGPPAPPKGKKGKGNFQQKERGPKGPIPTKFTGRMYDLDEVDTPEDATDEIPEFMKPETDLPDDEKDATPEFDEIPDDDKDEE